MISISKADSARIALGEMVFELDAKIPAGGDLASFPEFQADGLQSCLSSPGFAFSRSLYRLFKVDPTRHRPSSEALLRRISQGLPFPTVLPLVDLINRLSLMYMVPYGLYDMDQLSPPLSFRQGRGDDGYEGIRKGWLSLRGKIVLADDRGPFGNPSGDSLRSAVNAASKRILVVIFFHPDDPRKSDILKGSRQLIETFFAARLDMILDPDGGDTES